MLSYSIHLALASGMIFCLTNASAINQVEVGASRVTRSEDPICNFKGTVDNPAQPIQVTTNTTEEACRDACLNFGRCLSFSFNDRTRRCAQYNVTVAAQQPDRFTGGFLAFWDRTCFIPDGCKFRPVRNPGFDTGLLSPWTNEYNPRPGPNNRVHISGPGGGNGGGRSVVLSVNNTRTPVGTPGAAWSVSLRQTFSLCGGDDYNVAWSQLQVPGQTVKVNGCTNTLFVRLSARGYADQIFSWKFTYGNNSDSVGTPAGVWKPFGGQGRPIRPAVFEYDFTLQSSPGCAASVRIDDATIEYAV